MAFESAGQPNHQSAGERLHLHLVLAITGALEEIFEGAGYADKVIEKTLRSHRSWGSKDRRFVAETIYEMVRWWRPYLAVLGFTQASKESDNCLYGFDVRTQGLELWVVHRLHKKHSIPDWPELKEIDPENIKLWKERLPKVFAEESASRHSMPDWLYEELKKQIPAEELKNLLPFLNEQAPVDLRANLLRADANTVRSELGKDLIDAELIAGQPESLTLRERKNVFTTKTFHDGLFEVQDRASQRVAHELRVEPGMRVCDACAGAGGKTLHIATLMKNKGKVISLDIHDWKLKELRDRTSRNGIDIVETKVIDTTKVVKRMYETFDRVLLDVPCSGLGVLRRNPDTKWKLSPEKLKTLNDTQLDILTRYSKLAKKGGLVVYATCSILPSENQQIVEKFMANNKDFDLLTQHRLGGSRATGDGFFAAVMKRNL